jgi:hypothetical protein
LADAARAQARGGSLTRSASGLDPGQVHQTFIFGSDFPQVAEGRRGSPVPTSRWHEKSQCHQLVLVRPSTWNPTMKIARHLDPERRARW